MPAINQKINDAINNQVNAELYSSYLYLSMSAYLESQSLKGFANWMRVQAQEELAHTMILFNYINERGGRALMQPVDGPQTDWDSPLAVFENVYEHEQKVTGLINDLVDLAIAEKDHATNNFLQWFVKEQVEEEDSASDMVERVRRVGDSGNALYMLDNELAARVFKMPSPLVSGE